MTVGAHPANDIDVAEQFVTATPGGNDAGGFPLPQAATIRPSVTAHAAATGLRIR
jgi:hypothetical protein